MAGSMSSDKKPEHNGNGKKQPLEKRIDKIRAGQLDDRRSRSVTVARASACKLNVHVKQKREEPAKDDAQNQLKRKNGPEDLGKTDFVKPKPVGVKGNDPA
jgi:hypothetical protein